MVYAVAVKASGVAFAVRIHDLRDALSRTTGRHR
jgi:hypothetical protein